MNHPGETVTRGRHFAQVPDDLITDTDMSHLAVRVWIRLNKYAGIDGRAFPSRARLAADLGVSKGGIARALSDLSARGWITRAPLANGTVWNTTLHNTRTERPSQDDPDSHMSRPQPTCEPPPTQIRVTEGDPTKETQQGHELNWGAAERHPPTKRAPASDWRAKDLDLFLAIVDSDHLCSDGTGPWQEGTFRAETLYEALRAGNSHITPKAWPGRLLDGIEDWEHYLRALGVTVSVTA